MEAPLASQEDPFAQLGHKRRPWWIVPLILLVVGAIVAGVIIKRRSRPVAPTYLTEHITTGDVEETVEATGTVQPVLQVQVGSQVSGRISRVLVDFNSHVHQGDLVAEIDQTPFRAAVASSRAAVASARASLSHAHAAEALARVNFTRNQALLAQHLVAQSDFDQSHGALDVAIADLRVAEAEVGRNLAAAVTSETNLTYTRIVAPIDGVVIQRSIDPGQTVAASFTAPVLFIIANDLSRMQILANIDEADVGKLHEQSTANARVDAFPGENFRGTVSQIRFGSVTSAGVVTYPAVVDVQNPDLKLRPGMTATIVVTTQRHTGVLRVPNAALRYRPGTGTPGARPTSGRPPRTAVAAGTNGTIYVLRNGQAVRVSVRVGITDGYQTEVTADGLRTGESVILDDAGTTAGGRPGAPAGGGQPRRLF